VTILFIRQLFLTLVNNIQVILTLVNIRVSVKCIANLYTPRWYTPDMIVSHTSLALQQLFLGVS